MRKMKPSKHRSKRANKQKSKPASPRNERKPFAARKPHRGKATTKAPISETVIVDALRAANRPLPQAELVAQLNVKPSAQVASVLDAALQSGAVIRNRRDELLLRERVGLLVGTISGHRDGYGFVHPDDRAEAPVFLSHRQMTQAMHGDRVAVRVVGRDFKGRSEGAIVEVLERGTREIVGRLYEEAGMYVVVPENTRITHRILVPREKLQQAKAGQVVLVKLIEQPSRSAQPLGHVTRVLGEHAAPGMETDIAIHSHSLPFEFPDAAVQEAEQFGESIARSAKRNRIDLREVPLVTIDGEDARDFDDAVWCERKGGGWRLLVAIADVGHYVASNTALDAEAQNRGTSVYFPNRVLPMLPEALSNGLCSLKPDVERLCVVCEMHINAQGKVTRSNFFEAVMRSAARLTYTEVAAYLAKPQESKAAKVGEELRALHELYRALHRARIERGAIDFDAPELKVRFDAQGKIAAFVEQPRNDAHRLIEECMIAANVEAARFLKKHRIPTLYRVHGQPEQDRLEQLHEFLKGFGVSLPRDRELTSQDFSGVLRQVADSEESRLIETVVIRTMPQAVYQPNNIGHFGLSLPHYAHFTSPIRRYPDLIVHRGIRHVLRGGTVDDLPDNLLALDGMGQQCSLKERRADDATRDAMSWLKCEFMSGKLGEEFDALVTGVVDFGLFVQVKGMQVDGLVHVSSLGSDYFTRDSSGYRLVGQRSKRVFRLGDHLRVRLINVVIDERKIDFELAEFSAQSRGGQSRGGERRPQARQFGRRGRG